MRTASLTKAVKRVIEKKIQERAEKNLFVTIKVVCEDRKLHRISLHRNGQLHFHDHALADLKDQINLLKLGGQATCPCGEVLYNWRHGVCDDRLKGLAREKYASDYLRGIAARIWRRKNRHLLVHQDTRSLAGVKTLEYCAVAILSHVATELGRRGYSTYRNSKSELKIVAPRGLLSRPFTDKEAEDMPSLLYINVHGSGYLKCFRSSDYHAKDAITSIGKGDMACPPIRFLADECERAYYNYKLNRAFDRNKDVMIEEYERHVAIIKCILNIDGSRVYYSGISENSDRIQTMIYIDYVTPVAAVLIAKEFAKIQERIQLLTGASAKLRLSPLVFPQKPGGGIGK